MKLNPSQNTEKLKLIIFLAETNQIPSVKHVSNHVFVLHLARYYANM